MASLDSTAHITFTVDTKEVEEAIYRLKAGLDVRTKCAIADCPKQGLEQNLVASVPILRVPGYVRVNLYFCDRHYEELKHMSED